MLAVVQTAFAQDPVIMPGGVRRPPINNPSTTSPDTNPNLRKPGGDTMVSNVERRDYSDDSLQVQVYTLGAIKPTILDTTIQDYTLRFPIPATHIYIGNDGSATKSLLFTRPPTIGWDPGFHNHDVYKLNLEDVGFYNTAKPYTELGMMIAGQQEMMVDILHTQNIKPYWNASFQYRVLSAPGVFRNQKNNHNNMQFTSC